MPEPSAKLKSRGVENQNYEVLSPHRVLILASIHIFALSGAFFFSKQALIAFFVMYFISGCLGLTVGFHRLLTHKSFNSPNWVRNILAFLGTLTMQGSPTLWVATHRAHHSKYDEYGDPHCAARGFLWSHVLWMLCKTPNGFRFSEHKTRTSDVANTKFIRFLDNNYILVNILTFLTAAIVFQRLDILVWSFPVRIVAFWHATWLVNSYAHNAGSSRRKSYSSRNSFWLSLIMFGEGWHDNHHRRQSSPSFQRSPWHIDIGYYCIVLMKKMGLASPPSNKRSLHQM